jgi:hypothetical protein
VVLVAAMTPVAPLLGMKWVWSRSPSRSGAVDGGVVDHHQRRLGEVTESAAARLVGGGVIIIIHQILHAVCLKKNCFRVSYTQILNIQLVFKFYYFRRRLLVFLSFD